MVREVVGSRIGWALLPAAYNSLEQVVHIYLFIAEIVHEVHKNYILQTVRNK